MKLIISEYGALILAIVTGVLVLSAVIFLVFGNGKGSRDYTESLKKSAGSEGRAGHSSDRAMKNAVNRRLPEIRTESGIKAGTAYRPEHLVRLKGRDFEQKKHEIRILKIWNFQGSDCSEKLIRRDGSLVFPEEGVYRMKLFLKDEKGASGTMEVYLGVGL